MLDDLRSSAAASYEEEPEPVPEARAIRRRAGLFGDGPFLGMTAPQRFVIALMVLILTCVLSSFCLLLTEKIVLPF